MKLHDVARSIEISVVQSYHSLSDVVEASSLAKKHDFSVVYSLPAFTGELAQMLKGSQAAVGAVVSFPSGGETKEVRVFQAERLVELGAQELDMVLNIGYLKAGRLGEARAEVEAVKLAIGERPLKVILEAGHLEEDELKEACRIVMDGGADYAKTGTGWVNTPTTFRQIEIMSNVIQGRVKIKASGGIRTLDQLMKMHDMGVSRFGIRIRSAVEIYEQACNRLEG